MTEAVPPHDPGTGEIQPDDLEALVRAAQRQLQEAGGAGAFARDPYRLVLAALYATLDVFPPMVRRVETRLFTPTERQALSRAVEAASQAGVEAATKGALDAVAAQARARDRMTLAIAGGVVFAVLLVTTTGAFLLGRSSGKAERAGWLAAERADIRLAEQSMSLPVAEARAWALLIQANPAIREALGKATGVGRDPAGRPHGNVPLWLDVQRTPP